MMNRKVKIMSACVLTLAVTLSGLVLPRAYGAKAVDTDQKCSIEFNLQNNVYEGAEAEDFKELEDLQVEIHLYQVAAMKEIGAYEALSGYEDLELDKISETTDAAAWAEKAAKAKELVGEKTPDQTLTLEEGTGTVNGLSVGMYLVVAEEVQSDYFTYSFKESLISLPNNYYYSSGSDEWVYNLTGSHAVGLKPNREERLGDLEISKTLTSYNATVGGATFVFHVKVEKLDGTATTNVYKMEFAGTGKDTLVIKDIPAGAKVTVTESYTGSSYQLVSEKDQQATIVAEEMVPVEFVNEYDGGHNGGSGVVNRFYKDGETVDWENDL